MTDHSITDEELMAFADGVLDEPRFSEIAAAIEADEALAQRLEEIVVGGRAARALYGPLADRPVPPRLRGAVRSAIAAAERRARLSLGVVWRFPAAAALAALIAGPIGYLVARNAADAPPLMAVGQAPPPALAAQLEQLPSGAESRLAEVVVRPIATFRDSQQVLCREVELDGALTTVAVACHQEGEWRVAIAIDAPATADAYAPASSLAALDAYLESIEAGPVLSPEAEREALSGL